MLAFCEIRNCLKMPKFRWNFFDRPRSDIRDEAAIIKSMNALRHGCNALKLNMLSLPPIAAAPPWSPSRSPQPRATQLSVVSPLREWKVDRDKLNRAIYNHKESEHRKMPRPIDLDLAPLLVKCRAKFYFTLHPYGLDWTWTEGRTPHWR